jgi:hypothetical protein
MFTDVSEHLAAAPSIVVANPIPAGDGAKGKLAR